jgi:hypothetical protein
LRERQDYLKLNGYLNTDTLRGLEKIYSAVVTLVLSEKILNDFYRKTEKYRLIIIISLKKERYTYLTKNIKEVNSVIEEKDRR